MLIDITPSKGINRLTCSLVLLYFVEEYNIYSRLERKLASNELEMLKSEAQGEGSLPQPPKKKKTKRQIVQQENTQSLTSCCHYFVG